MDQRLELKYLVILIVFTCFAVLPIVWLLLVSLRPAEWLYKFPPPLWVRPTLEHYVFAVKELGKPYPQRVLVTPYDGIVLQISFGVLEALDVVVELRDEAIARRLVHRLPPRNQFFRARGCRIDRRQGA